MDDLKVDTQFTYILTINYIGHSNESGSNLKLHKKNKKSFLRLSF